MTSTVISKSNSNTLALKKLLEEERATLKLPREGDVVEGPIIAREGNAIYIDLGIAGTGVVFGKEYYEAQSELKDKKIGDIISAKIVEFENENGLRELSMSAAGKESNWQKLERIRDDKELITVEIKSANRGGLMVEKEGIEGFLPVSQLAPNHYPRVEGGDKEKILRELQKFVNKNLEVRVLDVDQRQNKFIVSEKAGEEEAIKKLMQKYKVGDIIEGDITGIVDFGAFIKLDPLIEGLIHISELDWELIEHPQDVINIGDKVQAKIIDITPDGRLSLSLKALKDDPWKDAGEKYAKGTVLKGTVSKLNSYGALVKIADGIQGLVHISEFASEDEMKEKLKEKKQYTFEITQVAPEERRITLKLV